MLNNLSIAGAGTLLVLFFCSLYVGALGAELRRRWSHSHLDGDWLLAQIRYLLYGQDVSREKAQAYLKHLDRPAARILAEVIAAKKPDLDSGDYLLSTLVARERLDLELGLAGMGTVAVIAPFVGLFGTVVGITNTFAEVADQGKAGIEVVSAGVSEALVATAIGLLVAIVSVVLFNYFKSRFDYEVSAWDNTARTLLSMLTSEDGESLLQDEFQGHDTSSAERFLEQFSTASKGD